MVDASKGFIKDGPKNRLRTQDIHKIVDAFTKHLGIERYSRMVPLAEIADPKNDYNLNIPRYIDSSEPEDIQDLYAHLHGGIPNRDLDALAGYWDAFPELRTALFKRRRAGYSALRVDIGDVQQTILDSDDFSAFAKKATRKVDSWFTKHRPMLQNIDRATVPNELIATIGDDLLSRFKPVALLDEYDVYEQLMTYWHNVMHDDVFLIMNEGWMGAANPRKTIEDKDRKLSETPDLVIGSGRGAAKYKMDLIPPALIVARYFADEQAAVAELVAQVEEAGRAVEDYTEEHAVEDGLLAEAVDDDGKIKKAFASARLKEAKREKADADEIKALEHLIGLYDAEAVAKKKAKEAQAALDEVTLKRYGKLTLPDVKDLVVDDKWHTAIATRVVGEVNSLTLELVARIQELGERYAETVTGLDAVLEKHEARVASHLAAMGMMQQLLTGKTRLPGFTEPWTEVTLLELADCKRDLFNDGDWIESPYITSSGNRLLQTGNIGIGQLVDTGAKRYVSDDSFAKLKCKEVAAGDILICRLADPAGRACIATDIGDTRMLTSVDVTIFRPNPSKADRRFLVAAFSTPQWFQDVNERCGGSTRSRIARSELGRMTILLPSVKEQAAIADAITDEDQLIASLQRRLTKARAIKQGMMQQLLTGRTRLPAAEGRA
jgi:hypothetical protein